jgi:hypothetical protein
MATITLDSELQRAMRDYLMAVNRVQNAEERGDVGRMSELRREQAAAAEAYVGALVVRGWRAPTPATPRTVSLVD